MLIGVVGIRRKMSRYSTAAALDSTENPSVTIYIPQENSHLT